MSRVIKNKSPWHILTLREGRDSELIVVGSGRSTYLWTGPINSKIGNIHTFGNANNLRKLAHAILKSTAPRKRKGTKQ